MEVKGNIVSVENERFYKIEGYHHMPEFFMSIVSNSDHFMFIWSNGALTAGRRNKENALFPYYTGDKLRDFRGLTGSLSLLRVSKGADMQYWEPFAEETERAYHIERSLYKSLLGNKLIFEEINRDLGLQFRYTWCNSDRYGIIRRSSLKNLDDRAKKVELLDGMQNILPASVEYAFQNEYSNLLDAYKKNELLSDVSLGIYSLSSVPVDKPEPSEALSANTIWSDGPTPDRKILLSGRQLKTFKLGGELIQEEDVRASRGAYFINCSLELNAREVSSWFFAAEVGLDSAKVHNLYYHLQDLQDPWEAVERDIEAGSDELKSIVGKADGLQSGNDEWSTSRHYSNTLYNVMRGGTFVRAYRIDVADLEKFAKETNLNTYREHRDWFGSLPEEISYPTLQQLAATIKDKNLLRICREYLPLTFSRRHGDPSRPWNNFSIENKNSDGSVRMSYEGNWRDIFQNWEALSLSFPAYIEGMVSKFVNASTADGYNPYRITRQGIDWEVLDPDDPWAFIGYWGDHQIIYLLKLLENLEHFYPGRISALLEEESFVFADVPYEIKGFEAIAANPRNTIDYNHSQAEKLLELYAELGADGKLLRDANGGIIRANFLDKLLIPLLTKLSNFIPEGGIWLNTQRPEWNDANNALVGNGVSMVTLYYIRRYLSFLSELLSDKKNRTIPVRVEVLTFLREIHKLFEANKSRLKNGYTAYERYELVRDLGVAGEKYRKQVYRADLNTESSVLSFKELRTFIDLTLLHLDHSIEANRRRDGLYHSYNLLVMSNKTLKVKNLYEMLEGQVAVLSSGYLSPEESADLLDVLRRSSLYREDQNSYILYPDRDLGSFMDKNSVPGPAVNSSALLQRLIRDNNRDIIIRDKKGLCHFNSELRNADHLSEALSALDGTFAELVKEERELVLDIYEQTFNHAAFTGRSGTFFAYEGLGSIYWHMVSKLLLAVQENFFKATGQETDPGTIKRLRDHYYQVQDGIGLRKSPQEYGAFPTDAYSHTPAGAGVKQPGLTGQVKEDILTRYRELGLSIINGKISFSESLLNKDELLKHKSSLSYINPEGRAVDLDLGAGQLGFTFCQVPIIISSGQNNVLRIGFSSGEEVQFDGSEIPEDISEEIFNRSGKVVRIAYMFR